MSSSTASSYTYSNHASDAQATGCATLTHFVFIVLLPMLTWRVPKAVFGEGVFQDGDPQGLRTPCFGEAPTPLGGSVENPLPKNPLWNPLDLARHSRCGRARAGSRGQCSLEACAMPMARLAELALLLDSLTCQR